MNEQHNERAAEVNDLIAQYMSQAEVGITASYKTIKITVELGGKLAALKQELGKDWEEWRNKHIPEAIEMERGATKLHRLHDRQPELFKDVNQFTKLGRWAGLFPPTPKPKPKPKATPSKTVFLLGRRLDEALNEVDWENESEQGKAQVLSALGPILEWVRMNVTEGPEGDAGSW